MHRVRGRWARPAGLRAGSQPPPIGALPCGAPPACHPMHKVIHTTLFAAMRVETAYVSTGDWLNDLGVIAVHPCDAFCTVIKQGQGSSLCSDRRFE